jgi:hypothetical protein
VARENHWYSIANDLVVTDEVLATARRAVDF